MDANEKSLCSCLAFRLLKLPCSVRVCAVVHLKSRQLTVKTEDPQVRELFDLVAQYWKPKPRGAKKVEDTCAEGTEEGDCWEEGAEDAEEEFPENDATVEPDGAQEGCENPNSQAPAKLVDDSSGSLCTSPPLMDLELLKEMGLKPCSPEPPSAYVRSPSQSSLVMEPPPPEPADALLASAPSEDDPAARLAYIEHLVCNLPACVADVSLRYYALDVS